MDKITIGEIGLVVTFLVGLISGIKYLKSNMKDWVAESLKDQLVLFMNLCPKRPQNRVAVR